MPCWRRETRASRNLGDDAKSVAVMVDTAALAQEVASISSEVDSMKAYRDHKDWSE